jgi:FeS assembly SUF system protein
METKIKKEDVISALKLCYDPEIPVNIYDLGLIYGIKIDNESISITMSLTSPFCPVTDYLIDDIKKKIEDTTGVKNVDIEITFDPPWNQSMMSDEAKAQLGL